MHVSGGRLLQQHTTTRVTLIKYKMALQGCSATYTETLGQAEGIRRPTKVRQSH